jgi:NAD(P)H-dependent flavin oxidoreductase YrpB (nitropropane dioxygenase family)
MFDTALTRVLNLDVPIIQAPIANLTSPELVAGVSNAGALGMLSVTWRTPGEIRSLLRRIRELTDRPFGVNLVLAWDMRKRLEVCLEEGVPVVSFFWGDPSPYLAPVHETGAVAMLTVGSAEDARTAVDQGVDILVAQGWEAGGHVIGSVATLPLVPSVVDAAGGTPVVAAGGIADGRGLAAVLALGAAGAWIGTRFVASEEALAHEEYQERVVRAKETDTVHTTLFNVGWDNAPHRVLRNSTVAAWEDAGSPATDRPGEGEAVARLPDGSEALRYSDYEPAAGMGGDVEALAHYAGQSAGLVSQVQPAGDIVRQIAGEAVRASQAVRDALTGGEAPHER